MTLAKILFQKSLHPNTYTIYIYVVYNLYAVYLPEQVKIRVNASPPYLRGVGNFFLLLVGWHDKKMLGIPDIYSGRLAVLD